MPGSLTDASSSSLRPKRGASAADQFVFRSTAGFLVVALLLGGAGTGYPLIETLLEVAACALLFVLFGVRPALRQPLRVRLAIGLALAVLALPLVQLIPLPPAFWRALPGHRLAAEASRAAGLDTILRPLSLTPDTTRRALLALLPPIAMLCGILRCDSERRVTLLRLVLGLGVVSTLLGALQFASGGDFTFFETPHLGFPVGLFVSRNHQATLLLCCIAIAAVPNVVTPKRGRMTDAVGRLYPGILIVLFALGVLATSSRMGTSLLPLALVLGLVPLFWARPNWRVVAGAMPVVAAGGFLVFSSFISERAMGRLDTIEDDRYQFWTNTSRAVREALPWGTGLGSFVPVYQTVEPLENVGPRYANHAHNDYLELLLEAGLPAALLFLLFVALVLWATRESFRDASRRRRGIGIAALGVIALTLLHSIVDYPLRMTSLAVLFALAAGLTVRTGSAGVRTFDRTPFTIIRIGVAAVLTLAVGWQSVTAGWSDHMLHADDPVAAARAAPWSAAPLADQAARQMAQGDETAATGLARAALTIEPLQGTALRVYGLAQERSGRPSAALVAALAKLGWRDLPTQLWLMDHAAAANDPVVTVQRIDALLRRDFMRERLFDLLRTLETDPLHAAPLAARLAARPPWRAAYLEELGHIDVARQAGAFDVLLRLKRSAAPPTRQELGPVAKLLIEQGRYGAAARLLANRTDAPKPFNGGFAMADADTGAIGAEGDPFDWVVPRMLGVALAIEPPPTPYHGTALKVETDGLAPGVVLSQLLVLEPGDYVLSASWLSAGTGTTPPASWDLRCSSADVPAASATFEAPGSSGWHTATATVTIDGSCPAWQLELRLSSGIDKPIAFWTDDVTLRRGEQVQAE